MVTSADPVPDDGRQRPAGPVRRVAGPALTAVWIAFWIALFLLGLQEYRFAGGRDLGQLISKYATAAVVCTGIALIQLARARRLERWLGRPLRWFAGLWAWLPAETLAFVVAMYFVPRAAAVLIGFPFDNENWLASETYDCAKFLFFYLLAGGVQFGIHSYRAWANERIRAVEMARAAQEAQLTQLTQQLQPHFLFNGMNLISSLIHTDPTLADTLLTKLATLLRAATGAGRHAEQPLGDELTLLRAYADIMTQRFTDRVRLDWEIDQSAAPCLVPTFGLQPLLENCFRHVVERRSAPTHIVVRARRERDMLRIEVEDDGDEFRDAPLTSGVGLGNLRRRLQALHGERARVALIPRAAAGLIVRVELPCAC